MRSWDWASMLTIHPLDTGDGLGISTGIMITFA